MPARILIAEDDRKQAGLIRGFLEREGYTTTISHDGRSAVEEVRRQRVDLLVLDLMLPRLDGLDVCRVVRSEQDIPVIMLTARSSEDDLLLGLALGADDYLTKPFSPRELVARVRTVLRRATRATSADQEQYQVGGLSVDLARHEARVDGTRVETTPAEFNLLSCLAAAPGRAFPRQLLLEHASGLGRDATARTIDYHVMNLRRKIEPVPTRPRYLLTVYGVGYKMSEPAEDAAADGDEAGDAA
ncbi:DNA-binding response OmpR family regulator [Lipingzhangella halophila]|uniref:DNA-binding response OmpR family regulator n=1 Tax=Lipingzhangella halophila TaxID=1783352 RepID=A0A7W7RCW0_9ACTN|nr:response regulator transcription factor [Lipingzhangella halophila]MBB4929604.1 DNA-binding response OmpR family regulator [Lipingzhangella halophila]